MGIENIQTHLGKWPIRSVGVSDHKPKVLEF